MRARILCLMPWFRCTDSECGHRWFDRSILDDTRECPECGETSEIFDPDDDEAIETQQTRPASQAPRIAYARELARKRVTDAGITAPPVPVRELAKAEGLKIVLRQGLGTLRGRLVG